ncbi:MAG: hypothetical protein ACLFQC_06620 [Wenzhouxiangella sp.]
MTAQEALKPEQAQPPGVAPISAGSRADRLSRWLTLGANLGVLLGLIILIIEVHQNASLTRLSLEVSKNALLADIELSLAQPEQAEIWVKSYLAPETMNDIERRVVESYLVALLMQWDYMLQMNRSGLITRSDAEQHIRNTGPFYFGSRFAKLWFTEEMSGWEGTDMMEIALPIVEGLDEDFLRKRAERLRMAQESSTPSP